jgi:hypothetical protein
MYSPTPFLCVKRLSKELLGTSPPYNPDLVSSDNHLFQFSKNWKQDKYHVMDEAAQGAISHPSLIVKT